MLKLKQEVDFSVLEQYGLQLDGDYYIIRHYPADFIQINIHTRKLEYCLKRWALNLAYRMIQDGIIEDTGIMDQVSVVFPSDLN